MVRLKHVVEVDHLVCSLSHFVDRPHSAEASVVLNGVPGASNPVTTVSQNGVKEYGSRPGSETYFDIADYTAKVNSATTPFTNVYAETFVSRIIVLVTVPLLPCSWH